MLLLITFLYLFYPKFIGHRVQARVKRKCVQKRIKHRRLSAHAFSLKNIVHTIIFDGISHRVSGKPAKRTITNRTAFTIVSAHNEVWEIYGRWYYRAAMKTKNDNSNRTEPNRYFRCICVWEYDFSDYMTVSTSSWFLRAFHIFRLQTLLGHYFFSRDTLRALDGLLKLCVCVFFVSFYAAVYHIINIVTMCNGYVQQATRFLMYRASIVDNFTC